MPRHRRVRLRDAVAAFVREIRMFAWSDLDWDK
jgi:hypothetical protein